MRSSSVATNTSDTARHATARSYTCWIIGLPLSMTNGFPGNLDEPYRAGMTTTTEREGLLMPQYLSQLLGRDRCRPYHADYDASRIIRQNRPVLDACAGRKRQCQRPDNRIAGAGHIVDLPSLRRQVPGHPVAFIQTHSLLTTRDEHRLAA